MSEDKEPPARDELLAAAIANHQNLELINQDAREVAVYWTTLATGGVAEESATELTLAWLNERYSAE